MKIVILVFFTSLLSLGNLVADDGMLKISGKTFLMSLENGESKPQGDVVIRVYTEDSLYVTSTSAKNARYAIELPFHQSYRIEFGGEDYTSKTIHVDARDCDQNVVDSGYKLSVDMTVIQKDGTDDFSFLNDSPITKVTYNKKEGMMVFDADYTEVMYARLQTVIEQKIIKQ